MGASVTGRGSISGARGVEQGGVWGQLVEVLSVGREGNRNEAEEYAVLDAAALRRYRWVVHYRHFRF